MKVIVQMRTSPAAHAASMSALAAPALVGSLESSTPGLTLDTGYAPVQLPGVHTTTGAGLSSLAQPLHFSMAPQDSTYLVRGSIPDGVAQATVMHTLAGNPDVLGVFSDPLIESSFVCPGSPAVGAAADVAKALAVSKLHSANMDGRRVYVAIVDTGINMAHLKANGVTATLNAAASWTPSGISTAPGSHPVGHGTMCAYDACIAAPKAVLLDCAVLLSTTPGTTVMAGLLSDAVQAYAKLRTVLAAMPEKRRAMVINNSWGMFSPAWDFPPGHPGNYSDNPNHPFNVIVASLAAAGADILFAAGNCGLDCPDGRCAFGTTLPICGANSHDSVLSVAGVDVKKSRVGYSSQGPGRLTLQKPDIAAYTHFAGSTVYPADGGTSAACPVAAGVLAAVRSKYPATRISPLQLRSLVKRTAEDRGGLGYDFDYGWGIINGAALLGALPP